MCIESLDARRLLSGNVVAIVAGGALSVVGDASANAILVERAAGGRFILTGLDGTTVNGRASVTTDAVTAYARFSLDGGDDRITLSRVSTTLPIAIEGGKGDDSIEIKRGTLAAVDISGNDGADTIALASATVTKRLRVFGNDGRDVVGIRDLRARRGFEVSDPGTGGRVGLLRVAADGASWLSSGGGNDRLDIVNSSFDSFSAKLRGGNDNVFVRGTVFDQFSPIDGGEGTNEINREILIEDDFGIGDLHGWYVPARGYPHFSNRSATAEEFHQSNNGTFGFQPIAPTTGLSGQAFSIEHRWTAYMVKRLNVEEGLIAGQNYSVTLTTQVVVSGDGLNGHINVGATGSKRQVQDAGSDSYGENPLTSPVSHLGTLVLRQETVHLKPSEDGTMKIFVASYYGLFTGTAIQFRRIDVKLTPV